ncbi:sigma-70 family RNA polymerase sigma factor [Nocardia sp. NBC_00565]|uniref:sigma-70 family RNA polymerase sigma factor n=1 Tax=Nocardia sp. NBC_00565 TaxID=2975993 RepID=UPI002E7FD1B7|nr:sigma-70 family RNA polymerase sigma factor [Nocardia sp. NBC_00565]WUC02628.1 sigma-70 family RNA polymerase sigma factor [Nocardia sp. NBC_00565]
MVAALLADLFESHRAHLLSVAYRLTGSAGDAEDAVQESWLRLAGARQSEIEDLRAWLTTVVSRICLDHLRRAAVRRESYVGQWLPEPVVTGIAGSSAPDPLEVVVRKQECSLAAMVVLERLTPSQRVAFVLHDGLSVPFDEIAEILGVSVEAARQLAVRARKSVAQAPPPAPDGEHAAAVRKFMDALATGDIGAVTAALHPDSVIVGDANGTTSTAVNVVGGADKVGRFFLGLLRKYGMDGSSEPTLEYEFATVNGQLGLVLYRVAPGYGRLDGLARVVGFAVRDGLICGAYDLANPEKLTRVRLG